MKQSETNGLTVDDFIASYVESVQREAGNTLPSDYEEPGDEHFAEHDTLPEDHEEPGDEVFLQHLDCGHLQMAAATAAFTRNKRWEPGQRAHLVRLTGQIEGELRSNDGKLPEPVEVAVQLRDGSEATVLARFINVGPNRFAGEFNEVRGVHEGPHYALAHIQMDSDTLARRKAQQPPEQLPLAV